MPRPLTVVEHAMEVQARLRRLRKDVAPMYEAALATGDFTLLAEAHAIAETLRVGQLQAKRLAGLGEAIHCADGVKGVGHGRAA
jgi:hypothetical protein